MTRGSSGRFSGSYNGGSGNSRWQTDGSRSFSAHFANYYYIYQFPSIVCASCLFDFCLSATKVCFLSFFTP
ncbi:hypothetical protein Hdeb2414_s0274g00853901 [Helianthus debilis subsp. tardiflorus]